MLFMLCFLVIFNCERGDNNGFFFNGVKLIIMVVIVCCVVVVVVVSFLWWLCIRCWDVKWRVDVVVVFSVVGLV